MKKNSPEIANEIRKITGIKSTVKIVCVWIKGNAGTSKAVFIICFENAWDKDEPRANDAGAIIYLKIGLVNNGQNQKYKKNLE